MFIFYGEEIMERIFYMAIWFRKTLILNRGAGFGSDVPFRMIYVIWFMCVWTMIVVGANMVMHDITYNICHMFLLTTNVHYMKVG
jgi:hypothetical protein